MKKRVTSSGAATARSCWCFWGALLVAACLVSVGHAVAGDNVWTQIGPYGARVSDIAIHPSNPQVVYMSASTGVIFKSTDGGASWTSDHQSYGNALVMDPTNPQVIYAGSTGVSKSTDGGVSWTWHTKGLTYLNIVGLGIAPSNPQVLYASTLKGVHRSTDGGASWTPTNSIQSSSVTRALAVDPTNPQTVYFSIGISDKNKGLYKTTDGGNSWTRLKLDPPNGASMEKIVIDPSNPQTIYVGAWGAGVYRSADAGTSWTPINAGLTNLQVYAIAIDPTHPQTLYAGTSAGGVFVSADAGASWTPAISGAGTRQGVEALAVDPSSPQTIYAGTSDGVFRTTNGGASWTQVTSGMAGYPVNVMGKGFANFRTLYIGTQGGGILKTPDGGQTWIKIDVDASNVTNPVMALAVAPLSPQTLYAGLAYGAGGYKSTDGGASWTRIWSPSGDSGTLPPYIETIAIDPLNPETVYLGTYIPPNKPGEHGMFKSTDGGKTWTSMDSGLPPEVNFAVSLKIAPSNPRTLYLVGNRGRRNLNSYDVNEDVYRSVDGGDSWADVSYGLPKDFNGYSSWRLAVDPTNEKVIYAGNADNEVDPRLYKSTNGGGSWAAASAGLPTSLSILSLAIDPMNHQTVYAGTSLGVYRSTDGGASWATFGGGEYLSFGPLVVDPANQTIYAGVSGGGVYAIRVPDMGRALRMDFDGNGEVNLDDFFMFAEAFGKKATGASAKFDLDGDGVIGLNDFFLFMERFGRKAGQ